MPPSLPQSTAPSQPAADAHSDIQGGSTLTTWTCAGARCPWGASQSNHAIAWPAAMRPVRTRLSYHTSAEIYLPAARANGSILWIDTGTVRVYAGRPDEEPHRVVAHLAAGHSLHVEHLASQEVLSVQADAPFTYRATLPRPSEPAASAQVVASKQAFWRCNHPGCRGADWTGAVIAWPAGSAHQSNGRSGEASRSVFSAEGAPLYPYMGDWARGCKVTAESGVVQIIEWQRGAEEWRDTWLFPGQAHVIQLIEPQNSAMIESYEGSPGFSVSLSHCTPRPLRE